MGDKSSIELADAIFIDRDGRRARVYHRVDRSRPGQQLRRRKRSEGLKWCRECRDWLFADVVCKSGLCREHDNAEYRRRYADDGAAIRARVHARKRSVGVVDPTIRAVLFELFEGRCAYCPNAATTIDHLVAVSNGGESSRGNLVPACVSCNSKKRARSLDSFLREAVLPNEHLIINEVVMADIL